VPGSTLLQGFVGKTTPGAATRDFLVIVPRECATHSRQTGIRMMTSSEILTRDVGAGLVRSHPGIGDEMDPTKTPEGCICSIDWRGESDFTWYYKTACPVAMGEHPKQWERHMFYTALVGGFGYAGDESGGTIIINDGKVSCVFFVETTRGRWNLHGANVVDGQKRHDPRFNWGARRA